MKQLFFFIPLVSLILFSGCSKGPETDNSPKITLNANPNPVNFLGATNVSWNCINVNECKLNGQPVDFSNNIIIRNIISDTTFTLSCSGTNGNISKSITIKVLEKSNYYKILDILTQGRWQLIEIRALGLEKNQTSGISWIFLQVGLTCYMKKTIPIKCFKEVSLTRNFCI